MSKVFVSYSHKDASWLDVLKHYLGPIIQEAGYGVWDDTLIEIGDDWFKVISENLQTARAGILLISHHFTTSDFIREHELRILLERAEHDNCKIVAIAISPFYDEFVKNIKGYQWANSPEEPLQKVKVEDGEYRFEKELIRIGIKLKRILKPDGNHKSPTNLHILTGVKGGIGKTLLSLATLCTYLQNDFPREKLLCVDINTTNIDFYRLIAGKSDGEMVPRTQWRYSKITQSPHYVAKRRVPYALLNGSSGFWKEMSDIVNHEMFHGFDVIVDTNLHIMNLIDSGSETKDMITQVCSSIQNRHIYLWIIWTFASLADDEYVEKGVASFRQLLEPHVADRITIVHVLNPSALTAPQISIQEQIKALAHIQHRKEQYDRLIDESERDGRLAESAALRSLRDQYLSEVLDGFRIEDVDLETPQPFPGLDELVNHEIVTSDTEYHDFIDIIGRTITDNSGEYLADIFDYIYRTHFINRGRPRNLLLISTYDPKLRGYTEHISQGDLGEIRKQITHVQRDVSKFLLDLTLEPQP